MLWASRVACSFSSWSVASLTRNEVGSILLMRLGLKEALLERKLRPWLRSGFREGIVEVRLRRELSLRYRYRQINCIITAESHNQLYFNADPMLSCRIQDVQYLQSMEIEVRDNCRSKETRLNAVRRESESSHLPLLL